MQPPELIYDGNHTLQFDPEKHRYYLDGVYIPSTTTVLEVKGKPQLAFWGANKAVEIVRQKWHAGRKYAIKQIESILKQAGMAHVFEADEAKGIGTAVHDWFEAYARFCIENGHPPLVLDPEDETENPDALYLPYSDEARSSVLAFLDWVEQHDVEFILVEQRVVSVEDGWAGTLDLLARVDGVEGVWDYKTSKAIYGEHFIQAAAYAKALREMGIADPKELWVLRVPKDGGEFEAKCHTQLPNKWTMAQLYNDVFLSLKKVWNFNNGSKRRKMTIK